MTQIFGYKLTAPDGSESNWNFFNNDLYAAITIRLKNGSFHQYDSSLTGRPLSSWAADRNFKVETCVFDFDPVAMAFTRSDA